MAGAADQTSKFSAKAFLSLVALPVLYRVSVISHWALKSTKIAAFSGAGVQNSRAHHRQNQPCRRSILTLGCLSIFYNDNNKENDQQTHGMAAMQKAAAFAAMARTSMH